MKAIDPNVESVREKLRIRAEHGFAKYGVTTERNDIDLIGWLNHLQEEMMDACVYIERTMRELRGSESDLIAIANFRKDHPEHEHAKITTFHDNGGERRFVIHGAGWK